MLTRIIIIILVCSLIFVPSSVFASSGPGAPWDATYIWYNVGSDGSGDVNNGNVLFGLSQMSRSLMWIGQWIYDGLEQIDTVNSWLNSIYSNMNSYTSLIYDRVNGYLPTMSSNLTNLYNRVDSMYTNIVNISGYNNAQLTQLQQINTKLDTINSVKWTRVNNFSFGGISSDGLSFITSDYINGSLIYAKSVFTSGFNNDHIIHVRLPIYIQDLTKIVNIEFADERTNMSKIIYWNQNNFSLDIYVSNSSYRVNNEFVFKIIFDSSTRVYVYTDIVNTNYNLVEYINYLNPNYYVVLNALANLSYLDQISHKLDNIEVSVDTSDIVEAINALDITQDVDIDISQDITQTTNLITQLRNLFGTGVTIPQFVQQTQDQSLLGWFSQSNSDNINHVSTGYNEAPY